MIPPECTAAVLLCAGLSRRFGAGNKLLAPLAGKPLLAHAAELLRAMPFARRIAVVGVDAEVEPLLGGFELARNAAPEAGQDSSVRIGLAAALAEPVEGVLICLGDMPFVTRSHLLALAERAEVDTAATSFNGQSSSPPVLMPRQVGKAILESADRPVRAMLQKYAVEAASPREMLRDFDTQQDFLPPRSS